MADWILLCTFQVPYLTSKDGTHPDVLHVLPAADHAVLHGVVHLQHGAQLARIVTHHQVFHLNKKCNDCIADPDPRSFWSAGSGSALGIRIRKAQNDPQNWRKFKFLSARRSFSRDEDYSFSLNHGCGSGSGSLLDPDSIRSVDPDPYVEPGSRSRRAKMTHKSRKKIKKFHILKFWMFFFESWRLH